MIEELLAFLTARLDEDERIASEVMERLRCGCHSGNDTGAWEFNGEDSVRHSDGLHEVTTGASYGATFMHAEVGRYIARHDPARVLREVEAERRILSCFTSPTGEIVGTFVYGGANVSAEYLVKLLAAPYCDHPDFRAEWSAA